jgi:hypothetical protein
MLIWGIILSVTALCVSIGAFIDKFCSNRLRKNPLPEPVSI